MGRVYGCTARVPSQSGCDRLINHRPSAFSNHYAVQEKWKIENTVTALFMPAMVAVANSRGLVEVKQRADDSEKQRLLSTTATILTPSRKDGEQDLVLMVSKLFLGSLSYIVCACVHLPKQETHHVATKNPLVGNIFSQPASQQQEPPVSRSTPKNTQTPPTAALSRPVLSLVHHTNVLPPS